MRGGELLENPGLYIGVFGAYLGEVIIRTMHGSWKYIDDTLAVQLPDGDCVYPLGKVEKQLTNEEGDSIYGLYRGFKAIRQVKYATPQGPIEVIGEDGEVIAMQYTLAVDDGSVESCNNSEPPIENIQQGMAEKKTGLLGRLFRWLKP